MLLAGQGEWGADYSAYAGCGYGAWAEGNSKSTSLFSIAVLCRMGQLICQRRRRASMHTGFKIEGAVPLRSTESA